MSPKDNDLVVFTHKFPPGIENGSCAAWLASWSLQTQLLMIITVIRKWSFTIYVNAFIYIVCSTFLTLQSCLDMVKEAKDELVEYAPAPRPFVEKVLGEYINSIPDDSDDEFDVLANSSMGDLSIIEVALATVKEIHGKAQKGQMAVYEMCGVCPEWLAIDQVCKGTKDLIIMLEDILCLAMQGPSMLAEAHFLGELAYQKY